MAQESASNATSPPNINPVTMVRLGLVQMGLGIMSILTLSVLNRVAIDELAIPATIVGGSLAMYQFVAPARVWFGQLSDAYAIGPYNRTGYIWGGALAFAVLAFVGLQVVLQLNASVESAGWTFPTYAWIALFALTFALYGLGISATATPFFALLVDVTEESERSKVIGIVWSLLLVGIGVGAGFSSSLLEGMNDTNLQPYLNRLFTIVPAAVVAMTFVGTLGIERKYSRYWQRSRLAQRGDKVTLRDAIRILRANRQTGFFFIYLLVLIVGLFLQQPVLEPYAGEVFGMSVSQSTRLNIFYAVGSIISLTLTGFAIVPRLGKQRTARLGCLLLTGCFALLIASGFAGAPAVLKGAVFIFGLGLGVATSGSLGLMLDLTTAETAGIFTGMWGLAQALGQASATFLGGTLLDVGRLLFGGEQLAYSFVFGIQIFGMLVAVVLLARVDVDEFRASASRAVERVMASDIG